MPTLLPSTVSIRRRLLRVGSTLLLAASLAAGGVLPGVAWGAPPKTPKPTPAPFKPPYDVIQTIDAATKTLVVGHVNSKDTSTKQFKLTDLTEIQVNGDKATIASLTAGMKVSVTPGSDAGVAERVVASPAPK